MFSVSVRSYGLGRDKLPNATKKAPPRGTALARLVAVWKLREIGGNMDFKS